MLDKGEIAEFDTPDKLLSIRTSIFHSMAKDAGLIDKETGARKITKAFVPKQDGSGGASSNS